MQTPFNHVVIIGCGLLGTSLGLALRQRKLAHLVTGVGRQGSPSVATAQSRGAIDRATDDPAAAVSGTPLPGESHPIPPADLIVVCTPVRQFPEMFKTLAPALAPGALVTDVGSTKAQIMQWAAELLPSAIHFVGSHPMAGSEKSGPDAAREDLYQNAVCLVCPLAANASENAVQRILALWQAVGMRTIELDAAQHDLWVAAVSHLPQTLATTLVNTVSHDTAALQAAAGGFVDTSRIASGDVTMWTDILLTNREAVVAMMDRYLAEMSALRHLVKCGDETGIRATLTAAKRARDAFIAKRKAAMPNSAPTSQPPENRKP